MPTRASAMPAIDRRRSFAARISSRFVARCARGLAPLLEHAARVIRDAAVLDQLERFRCHRRQARLEAGPQVSDIALGEVDLDLVALFNLLVDPRRDDDRQPDIDAIAGEQPPEARCQDGSDTGLLHGRGGLLAARAATEILPTDNDVSALDLLWKLLVDPDHQMARHFAGLVGRPEPGLGVDEVGIDVAPERPGVTLDVHGPPPQWGIRSAGDTIRPAI